MVHMMVSDREKSKRVYADSCQVIPGGVNSPVRAFPGLDMTPLIVERGFEDMLIDADGKPYIDYCMSWGALILGHAHPTILAAAVRRMELGSSFGAITPVEEQLARKIISYMPWIEKLRFVSSGTEATMSALRLARGCTGKNKIIKFAGNFHGHSDGLLVQAGSGVSYLNPQATSKGVSAEMVRSTIVLPYNDVDALKTLFKIEPDIAGVIFEPVSGNMGVIPASRAFFTALREETTKAGALLIADEVITGFRVGLHGAQSLYGIEADLTCLGKIIGGGFPAAAFGGRSQFMDELAPLGEVYQGGTLSGNPVAMAAGLAALNEIGQNRFYEEFLEKTNSLLDPIRAAIQERDLPVCINQVGSMFTLFLGPRKVSCKEDLTALDHELFKQFFTYLFERGVYIPPSAYEAWFISSAHTEEHLTATRDLILEFFHAAY